MASCNRDITLASNEDDAVSNKNHAKSQLDESPPKKRARLITVDANSVSQPSYFIVSSDEEEVNISNVEKNDINSNDASLNDEKTVEGVKVRTDLSSTDNVIYIADDDDEIIEISGDEIIEISGDEIIEISGDELVQEESVKSDAANGNIEIENLIISGTSIEVNLEEADGEDVEVKEVVDSCSQEFYEFVDDCLQLVSNQEYKELIYKKLPTLKNFYKTAREATFNKDEFIEVVRRSSEKINSDSLSVLIGFADVYNWLKATCDYTTEGSLRLPKAGRRKKQAIKKLDKALTKLRNRIRNLEKMELEWDNHETEDTVYVQLDKYNKHAVQLYNILCKLLDENPNYERLPYMRLDFSCSAYAELNVAINRKYNNNPQFPTYMEVEKLIRSCAARHNLGISENVLKQEATQCFTKLGELLQHRRQLESSQFLHDLLENSKDPAFENREIAETIRANRNIYDNKLNQIFNKYARLQGLQSIDPQLSSDTDDSHYESNEEEENQEVGNY